MPVKAKKKPPLKKLTATIVTTFALAVAKKNLYEKKAAALRERILPLLLKGHKCPNGPFILQLSRPECPTWSWKDEYIALLASTRFGNTKASSLKKANALAERMQAQTLEPRPQINVVINPKWKGAVVEEE
jgi:hypothetical protein